VAEPDKSSIPIGERIAYHEAGHAVIGGLLSFPIVSLTMDLSNDDSLMGLVRFDEDPPAAYEVLRITGAEPSSADRAVLTAWLDRYAIRCLAGGISEQLLTGGHWPDSAENDLGQIHEPASLILETCGKSANSATWSVPMEASQVCLTRWGPITKIHVTRAWPWIQSVALAALDRWSLSEEDIFALRPTALG
jgi:hypothetical protein